MCTLHYLSFILTVSKPVLSPDSFTINNTQSPILFLTWVWLFFCPPDLLSYKTWHFCLHAVSHVWILLISIANSIIFHVELTKLEARFHALLYPSGYLLNHRLANYFYKGPNSKVDIAGFPGWYSLCLNSQYCCCSLRTIIKCINKQCGFVPIKLYLKSR